MTRCSCYMVWYCTWYRNATSTRYLVSLNCMYYGTVQMSVAVLHYHCVQIAIPKKVNSWCSHGKSKKHCSFEQWFIAIIQWVRKVFDRSLPNQLNSLALKILSEWSKTDRVLNAFQTMSDIMFFATTALSKEKATRNFLWQKLSLFDKCW